MANIGAEAVSNWLKANRYVYKDTRGKGVVRRMYADYDVYIHIEIYCRVAGKKHGSTYTYYLGRTYSWLSTKETQSYNVVRLVGAGADGQELFSVSDTPLGGAKETLG